MKASHAGEGLFGYSIASIVRSSVEAHFPWSQQNLGNQYGSETHASILWPDGVWEWTVRVDVHPHSSDVLG